MEDAPSDPFEIWSVNEVPTVDEIEDMRAIDTLETRERAEHEILFKQNVGSEDTYLGMGTITPATQHCSHIVIKAKFPVRENYTYYYDQLLFYCDIMKLEYFILLLLL